MVKITENIKMYKKDFPKKEKNRGAHLLWGIFRGLLNMKCDAVK